MDSETALLTYHLGRAHRLLQGMLEREIAREGRLGLQPAMRPIFCLLTRESGVSISELAVQLRLAKSSVTGALRRMEEAGLVEQRQDDNDGRRKRVWLTELGKSMIPVCERIETTMGRQLAFQLSSRDMTELIRLLTKLNEMASPGEGE